MGRLINPKPGSRGQALTSVVVRLDFIVDVVVVGNGMTELVLAVVRDGEKASCNENRNWELLVDTMGCHAIRAVTWA